MTYKLLVVARSMETGSLTSTTMDFSRYSDAEEAFTHLRHNSPHGGIELTVFRAYERELDDSDFK